MAECMDVETRERLPDLLHDRLSDLERAALQQHVDGCSECRQELELLAVVRSAAPQVRARSVDDIVARLPAPPARNIQRSAPARIWRRAHGVAQWRVPAAALAAVAFVAFAVAIAGRGARSPEPAATPPVSAAAPAVPVQSPESAIVTAEKAAPATKAPVIAPPLSIPVVYAVEDLSDEALATLLSDLEAIEASPDVDADPLGTDLFAAEADS